MRFRLRTLLILLVIAPVVLAGLWVAYVTPSLNSAPYIGPLPPPIRPGINFVGIAVVSLLMPAVLAARRLLKPRISP
jgi:hypothetical protein